jgi:uncharacterized sulfatase
MSRGTRWTYNSGLSVPMVVYFPPRWKARAPKEYQAGGKSDRMVSFVDLAPTLLSLAGVKPPEWMQGHAFAGKHQQEKPKYMFGFRGRMDERYDFIRTVTDGRYHYIRNYNPHFIYGQYVSYNFVTKSTAAWKRDYDAGKLNEAQSHFWNLKPAEELYDLAADPDEVNNLADSADHQAKLKELRKAQQDWCRRIRDLGFLPEGEIHSRSKGSTPREMGRDGSKYPYDKIFAAADLATLRGADQLPEVKELLKDPDSAVRYWGAVGILNRGADAIKASEKELFAALQDDSSYVRIAAGYAFGKYGNQAQQRKGIDALIAIAPWKKGADVFVSMVALNAIDKLDDKAGYALETIRTFPRSGGVSPNGRYNGYVARILGKTIEDLGGGKQPGEKKKKRKK